MAFAIAGAVILVLLAVFLGYMAMLALEKGGDYWTFTAGCVISACMAAALLAAYSGLVGMSVALMALSACIFFVRAMAFV